MSKWICTGIAAMLPTFAPLAHHSYSMFDQSQHVAISGTVAKLEWSNPHVFIWLYVSNGKGGYDLYGLENGSVNMLRRFGWTAETLKVGEKISAEYFPLKDGRKGGYFIKGMHADGLPISGDPYAPGGSAPAFGQPK